LPAPLESLKRYDAYIDLSAERVSTDQHWLDVCFEGFGFDASRVPPELKRLWLPPIPTTVQEELAPLVAGVRTRGRRVVLFHPTASAAIRSCPAPVARRIVAELLDRTDWTIVTAAGMPLEPRVVDWSRLSRTFDHFTYLISQVDCVVSVDTSTYHVADALRVPSVALFTTIRPEHRMGYSPISEGILLRESPNRLLGGGATTDPIDIAYAEALWDDVDPTRIIECVDRVVCRGAATSRVPDSAAVRAPPEDSLV
jgi:ADP-heptose:LPS heptosyltransferase